MATTTTNPSSPTVSGGGPHVVGRFLKKFGHLERTLALVLISTPAMLILFDHLFPNPLEDPQRGAIRGSISAYYDMEVNQVFYYLLTVGAMLFIVNGVVKGAHQYNVALGLALSGVILFNKDDTSIAHAAFAFVFFIGSVLVIFLFSDARPRRIKFALGAAIAVVLIVHTLYGWTTLFWAEWIALVIIAGHYILDSLSLERFPGLTYNATSRSTPSGARPHGDEMAAAAS